MKRRGRSESTSKLSTGCVRFFLLPPEQLTHYQQVKKFSFSQGSLQNLGASKISVASSLSFNSIYWGPCMSQSLTHYNKDTEDWLLTNLRRSRAVQSVLITGKAEVVWQGSIIFSFLTMWE